MQCDNHNHTLLIIIIIFISTQKTVPKHIKHAKKVIKMQNAVIFFTRSQSQPTTAQKY